MLARYFLFLGDTLEILSIASGSWLPKGYEVRYTIEDIKKKIHSSILMYDNNRNTIFNTVFD